MTALHWLLSLIAAGFVLQNIFLRWFDASANLEAFAALTTENLQAGKIWTLATYSFLHSTDRFPYLLHIVSTLLGLYWLGRELVPLLGARRFIGAYFAAIVLGALTWTAAHWTQGGMLMGASAGICGLLVIFACFYPYRQITFLLFFVFPISLKPKFIVLGLLAFDLCGVVFYEIMGALSPFTIAHSAHLGGMLAGWLYFKYAHEPNRLLVGTRQPADRAGTAAKLANAPVMADTGAPLNRQELRAELDRILDKINSEGFGALTTGEKRALDKAKDLLARR
ncbi:MAG: rhomboid family intramembrane serine protease [Opitutaceae bacterium]|nr:rhomboid family intramembrane serine protease [Opitutaceae bacterium]MBP9912536.1 rhomboid family intramembrane serine protease [Opitutaceae bacterium]